MAFRLHLMVALILGAGTLAGCNKSDVGDNVQQIDTTSLLGIVSANPNLSTLWGLIAAADLQSELGGDEAKTLLAPTNDAFAVLGQETLDSLIQPDSKAQLTNILRNHVFNGAVSAPAVAQGKLGTNEAGQTPTVEKDPSGAFTVGGARIVESIEASNGYMHVVDQVILP